MKKPFKKSMNFFLAVAMIVTQILVLPTTTYAADTVNLALNKPITASNYTQTYVATNSNDGSINSYWEGAANAYPNNLTVDLGSTQSVNKAVLKLNPATVWATRTQTFAILGSTDNISFTTITALATYTFNPSTSNTVTINFTNTNTRYVRLSFTTNSGSTGAQVAEFEVYGGTTTSQPDLSVTALTFTPANPTVGQTVTLTATVKNIGTATTPAGVTNVVGFNIGSTKVTGSTTSSIAAGGTATVTANWTSVGGTYTVSANADDTNVIAESSESNNSFSSAIQLVISGGGSTTKYEGESATLSGGAKVNTDHSGYTGTGFVDGIQTSGSSQALFNVNVATTGYYDVTLRYADAMGSDRTMSIYVNGTDVKQTVFPNLPTWNDWGNKVETLNLKEGNNTIAYKYDTDDNGNINLDFITVGPTTVQKADLVVTDITWTPASPVDGSAVNFSAIVKNNGTAAGAAGIVAFQVDGTQVTASVNNTTSIAVGGTATISGSSNWTSVIGSHTVKAIADNANTIAEVNENNNSFSKNITVSGQQGTDLVVTALSWTPTNTETGNIVTLTATVKNQGTVATAAGLANVVGFNIGTTKVTGSTSTVIAAGGTATVTATYTGVAGTYTVSAKADDTNVIVETNETNNYFTSGTQLVVTTPQVPGSRGATMPYTRYEAEVASIGGGAVLRSAPTFDYSQLASEATNQKYVALPSNGAYVEWTATQAGAGVDMRFTMPDKSDGMGLTGSLDCYVNGTKVSTISLSSYWSWQYFSGDQPQDAPGGTQAAFRFDEVHFKLNTALKVGDKIKIQKTNGDSIEYGVDFLEVEPVPVAIAKPTNAYSVTDYGAIANDTSDDLSAFNACVNAAAAAGKTVYIPEGKFNLGGMWTINANNITITGAGIWYTNIQFTSPNAASGGISLRVTGTIDFSNMSINSMLRSRYNQNAIYKCFMDNFGTNSRIHDFWEEHFECGFWVADYAHTPAIPSDGLIISNGRVRNNLADGINFCQGTKNSTVQNCNVRNNGDDGLAMWPDNTMGAPMEVNNTFKYNTIENNWRAAAIAIFGGSGHKVTNNYIKDCFMGSGIRMNTVFPGYHFESNTGITFSDTTIINSGTSKDCYSGERGAIDLEASNSSIQNVTFTNIDIINAQRDAIQFGYGGGFSNINFNNITIDGTGKDDITTSRFSSPHLGEAIYTYTGNGSATFTNLILKNIEAASPYLIQSGFNLTVK